MRHGAPPLCVHCGKPEREYHTNGYCDNGSTQFEIHDLPKPGDKFVEMPAKKGEWSEMVETVGEIVEIILDVYPQSVEKPGHFLVMWEEDGEGDDPRATKRTTLIKRGEDGRWVRAD